jgi:hypothetical protein
MEIIIHKINSLKRLKKIPIKFGVEIDVRSYGSNIILNHEPQKNGTLLTHFLNEYHHGTIIFNIKEAGIENEVISLAKKFRIKKFFLLDVEHPFIITSPNKFKKYLSVRFSEFEPIELSNFFRKFVSWIWIDTVNKLPINKGNIKSIKNFKSCIVSPERWGRKNDIKNYIRFFKKYKFKPTSVMTDLNCSKIWENF